MATADTQWYQEMRYGLFIHFGLYSMLGRAEWVMNKEQIPRDEYMKLADRFTAEHFDADALIARAKSWGMRYAILTTMHHEGFCLYNSTRTDFCAPKTASGRDLVREFVDACRKHGMKVGLYHSLNNWTSIPNSVDALEQPATCYQPFIDEVHGKIRDLLTQYGPIDIMWYDGWWPFGPDADGWQADKLNAMVRELVPGILINGRTGRKGDFDTPEGHIAASTRPWEACMTLNNSWGYHAGDDNWKSPKEVAGMLRQVAAGQGNLLLNVGPRGDGSIPEATLAVLDKVGTWLSANGDAIYGGERIDMNLRERGDARGDWTHFGNFTVSGNDLFLHVVNWPGERLVMTGLECQCEAVSLLATGQVLGFTQTGSKIVVTGLPATVDSSMPVVIRFKMDRPPMLYRSGGLRDPQVPHCRYDPVESDIAHI